jgi:rfaE bifunctional protein nucleotidyltransferase chain/domain
VTDRGASAGDREALPRRGPAPGVVDLARATAWRAERRAEGQRVVLTNGCFDLLHVGHVRYLTAARALGECLVVAVNDDASTRRLKGPGRPLVPVEERAEILAALAVVDAVVPFGDDTAIAVVAALAPDVYVKGGDYDARHRRPPEADATEAQGGRVVFVPLAAGHSTTGLLARIRAGGG